MKNKVYFEEGHFVIEDPQGFKYEISKDRIKTEGDLIRWTIHISEKNWIDSETIHSFLLCVCNENAWEAHGPL